MWKRLSCTLTPSALAKHTIRSLCMAVFFKALGDRSHKLGLHLIATALDVALAVLLILASLGGLGLAVAWARIRPKPLVTFSAVLLTAYWAYYSLRAVSEGSDSFGFVVGSFFSL